MLKSKEFHDIICNEACDLGEDILAFLEDKIAGINEFECDDMMWDERVLDVFVDMQEACGFDMDFNAASSEVDIVFEKIEPLPLRREPGINDFMNDIEYLQHLINTLPSAIITTGMEWRKRKRKEVSL